jgi:hypothetical protein
VAARLTVGALSFLTRGRLRTASFTVLSDRWAGGKVTSGDGKNNYGKLTAIVTFVAARLSLLLATFFSVRCSVGSF